MSANQYRYGRVTYNLLTSIHSALMFSSRVIDRRIKIRLDISYRMHMTESTSTQEQMLNTLYPPLNESDLMILQPMLCNSRSGMHILLACCWSVHNSFINYLYQAMCNITAYMLCSNIDSLMLPKITYFIHYQLIVHHKIQSNQMIWNIFVNFNYTT